MTVTVVRHDVLQKRMPTPSFIEDLRLPPDQTGWDNRIAFTDDDSLRSFKQTAGNLSVTTYASLPKPRM